MGIFQSKRLKSRVNLKTALENKIERVSKNILRTAGAHFRNRHQNFVLKVVNILDRQLPHLSIKLHAFIIICILVKTVKTL